MTSAAGAVTRPGPVTRPGWALRRWAHLPGGTGEIGLAAF
jgi:hypothetical protein